MATYLILNLIVVALIVLVVRKRISIRRIVLPLVILLIMTLVFDNIIVGLSIVGYDMTKNLGVFLGYVPIEDFFYALAAILIVPALWGKEHNE